MRLYAHLFLTVGCEAPGCRARRTSLYPRDGGHLIRACTPAHAQAADARLVREELEEDFHAIAEDEARELEAEQHLVEGEAVELDEPAPAFGPAGAIW